MSDKHDHSHEAHDHHEHGHSHGHGHNHGPKNYNRAFAVGIALNVGFVVVESVYGYLSNSLALISDAGHNLSDVLSLLLAWGATLLVQRRPTQRFSYGLKSSSILASLANAIFFATRDWRDCVGGHHPLSESSSNCWYYCYVGRWNRNFY